MASLNQNRTTLILENYHIEFINKEKYLLVIIQGINEDILELKKIWFLIKEKCDLHGHKKVLVDNKYDFELNLAFYADFPQYLLDIGFLPYKIAYHDPDMHNQIRMAGIEKSLEFAKENQVDTNVFENIADAEAWLLNL